EGDANAEPTINEPVVIDAPVVKEPEIFTIVEQQPEFPGGEQSLYKYLRDNIQYPNMERDNDIQGKVIVAFVVWDDGSIRNVEVKKGVSPGLDKEAKRVIEKMPKWKAGKQQGKAVPCRYVIPVVFRLQ
ncbi:MAG TPA: energy transducer TonB, partial [Chitinophagales bacterium]|nr:energy transducer TonB [Chitinophagales bacterium]